MNRSAGPAGEAPTPAEARVPFKRKTPMTKLARRQVIVGTAAAAVAAAVSLAASSRRWKRGSNADSRMSAFYQGNSP